MFRNNLNHKTVKYRFLTAILKGELGSIDSRGVVVTTGQFRTFFNDLNRMYATSFLPAATIEAGQRSMSHTKYLIRLNRGVYRLHEDAIIEHAILLDEEAEILFERARFSRANE